MFDAMLKKDNDPLSAVEIVEFPIPEAQYEETIRALNGIQSGAVVEQDCFVADIGTADCPALVRMAGTMANVDELDWLGKQLESFDRYELLQFNAAVERFGLSAADELIDLSFCAREVTVVSDFKDLELVGKRHYDNAESWRLTLLAHQNDFAEAMQIPLEHLHWYAAFHDEGEHPHIHMMLWSDDPQYGFLRKDRLLHMQSVLTNTIYADELKELYIQKDVAYKDVTEAAREVMRELVDRIGTIENPPESIQQRLLELALELRTVSGKKQYAYLKKPLKDMVDSIVDELEKLPEVAAYYSVWNGLRDTLEGYYKNRPRQHNPLSQQKEFRAIKNAIIQEAERLRQQMEQQSSQDEEPSVEKTSSDASANPTLVDENTSSADSHSARLPSEYLLNSTIRLFRQMSQIFRDNAAPPSNPMGIRMDSKRRKKLMQKRLAMGHKQDDHEQEQGYSQTLH